jgi:hypothetical protein
VSDGQVLLLVVALLYLSECVAWLPRGAVVIRRPWHLAAARPGSPGNDGGWLAWLSPLDGNGGHAVLEPWPFSLTPDGVSSVVPTAPNPGGRVPGTGLARSWDEVREISSDGSRVRVDGQVLARCAGPAAALAYAKLLAAVWKAVPAGREGVIRERLADALSAEMAQARFASFAAATAGLRTWCLAVLGWMFVVLPLGYLLYGDSWQVLVLAGGLFALTAGAAVAAFLCHRRLIPELAGSRWQHLAVSLLLPTHAARGADALARDALGGFHPLAAAAGDPGFRRALARDAWHPLRVVRDETAERFLTQFLRPAIAAELARRGEDVQAFLGPPDASDDPDAERFCPRCHALYRAAAATCADCPGVGLAPLAHTAVPSGGAK